MKLKKIQRPKLSQPESFNDLMWFKGYTPKEMEYLAAQNGLTCICYLPSMPVKSALFFHIKDKAFA